MVDLFLEDKKILAHERHALAPTTPPGFRNTILQCRWNLHDVFFPLEWRVMVIMG
jgi:hypothetical protein